MADTADDQAPLQQHKWYEDLQALLLGTLLLSFGVTLYSKAMLITGGVAGTSLLVEFATSLTFGPVFFVLNLPFFALSILRMGWGFSIRTLISIALISGLTRLIPLWIDVSSLNPAFAAVMGAAMMGIGLVVLLRHRAGIGGVTILSQFLQDKGIIRAGLFQLIVDLAILVVALFMLPLKLVALSIVGAFVLNLTVAINHKPGRYRGMS
ncbi:YitT family protein [Henriciella aquimarina]|uniref:YitT family protein n=1 Tax=Henriciella aquimarina TaxID=545261 RepID=UPI0009FFA483|nr:YitT family protein [Henriciella aquimarina]